MDEYMVIDLQPREAVINRLTVLRALVERSLLRMGVSDRRGRDQRTRRRRFDCSPNCFVTGGRRDRTRRIGDLPDAHRQNPGRR